MIAHNLPWIESPFFRRELEQSNLSEADRNLVESFAKNGYVIIDSGIDVETIDAAVASLEDKYTYATEESRKNGLPQRIHNAWEYNEFVRKVAVSPAVLEKLEVLYRRRPIPFQTLNFRVGTPLKRKVQPGIVRLHTTTLKTVFTTHLCFLM